MTNQKEDNIRDIFSFFPKWITKFHINGRDFGGAVEHTQDSRLSLLNSMYPLENRRVLELGCLEGAHTFMLHNLGCKEVIAIEGRLENYIKSCIIKNLFNLDNCKIIYADFSEKPFEGYGEFDLCVALGVLYHVMNPWFMMSNISKVTDKVFLWTHYADAEFPPPPVKTLNRYEGQVYQEGGLADPLSGLQPESFWLLEQELYRMIRDSGFQNIKILDKGSLYEPPHKHVLLYATKETDQKI